MTKFKVLARIKTERDILPFGVYHIEANTQKEAENKLLESDNGQKLKGQAKILEGELILISEGAECKI